MLRKILLCSVLLAGVASVKAQSNLEFADGKKVQEYWLDAANSSTDCHFTFKNVSGSATRVYYKKVEVDFPASPRWDVSFCDNRNCFFSFVESDTFNTIQNNEEAELKLTVFPNGNADTGIATYVLWTLDEPNEKDTITFKVYVPWGASARNIETAGLSVYPNPVSDVLNIQSAAAGQVSVVSVTGQVFITKAIAAGSESVLVSSLTPGVYTVLVESAGKRVQTQFVKI